jgi:hypothetical protein
MVKDKRLAEDENQVELAYIKLDPPSLVSALCSVVKIL